MLGRGPLPAALPLCSASSSRYPTPWTQGRGLQGESQWKDCGPNQLLLEHCIFAELQRYRTVQTHYGPGGLGSDCLVLQACGSTWNQPLLFRKAVFREIIFIKQRLITQFMSLRAETVLCPAPVFKGSQLCVMTGEAGVAAPDASRTALRVQQPEGARPEQRCG